MYARVHARRKGTKKSATNPKARRTVLTLQTEEECARVGVADGPVLIGVQLVVRVQGGAESCGHAVVVGEVGAEEDVIRAGEGGQGPERVAARERGVIVEKRAS